MISKGYSSRYMMIIAIMVMTVFLLTFVPRGVLGTEPEFSDYRYSPMEPEVNEPLNISITYTIFDEPITLVKVQSCFGGTCQIPLDMTDSGDGSMFFHEFPAGYFGIETVFAYFHVTATYGSGSSFTYPADPDSHELNVTLFKKARKLLVNATADVDTIFPGQLVTISGDISNDIDEQIEGAEINISIPGTDLSNTTITGTGGLFEIGIIVVEEGEHTLNLSASFNELEGYAEFSLSVNTWPTPKMGIEGEVDFLPEDVPPASGPNTFYTGSNVSLTYRVRNSGTGEAGNVSVILEVENATYSLTVDAGNISISQRFEDEIVLPMDIEGVHMMNISASWDQIAPYIDNFTFPVWSYSYEVVPRPEWAGHRVFVEMFTQTTCAPCVDVEESIEYLYGEVQDLDFEYIIYVTDDEESELVADEMGITASPDVFFDKNIFRMSGSNEKEEDMDDIRSFIENASAIETAPVEVDFLEIETDLLISLSLPIEYKDAFSGMLTVYKVESYSNIRNYQGIPIANRYMGVHTGQEITSLLPGGSMNFSIEHPGEGMGLIAVITSDDDSVINTRSYHNEDEPEVYVRTTGTPLLKLTTPAFGEFNITLDSFHFEEVEGEEADLSIWYGGLPEGWELTVSGVPLSTQPNNITFAPSETDMEVLPVGRIRYSIDLLGKINVPENVSGTFNFKVLLGSGGHKYSMTVVVMASVPDDNGDWPPEMKITDLSIVGEGKNIYFYVETEGVPDNATVMGNIIPCNYEGNQICGLPRDVVLVKIGEGQYRVSINNNVVDLTTYTHLTYNAWIVIDDNILEMADESRTVEISTLVDEGVITDDDDTSDTIDPLLVVISIGALFFALALAVVLFFVSRKVQDKNGVDIDVSPPSPETVGVDEELPIKGTVESPSKDADESLQEGKGDSIIEPPVEQEVEDVKTIQEPPSPPVPDEQEVVIPDVSETPPASTSVTEEVRNEGEIIEPSVQGSVQQQLEPDPPIG
ncbi:MAG: thioredoxin family protein [Candidatus Thermoplasmatota archaeon]|nr:thioredoxin family protein [Candidatus Thermoplasmatota archaeon]